MSGIALLWRFAAGVRGRLVAAALLGALAAGSAVALMATSGWLIARAAQQPPVLYLMVAVVAVRTFGIGRGVLRYAERLVGHDAAFRVLARLRERLMAHLAELAPTGLGGWRRGDLLSRLTSDVDDIGDGFLRGLLPIGVGLLVGAGTVGFVLTMLPVAGLVLAVGLLVAAGLAPLLAARHTARTQQQVIAVRGDRMRVLVEVFDQLGELTAAGLLPDRMAELRRIDARANRVAGRSARIDGVAAGLAVLAMGVAVVGGLWWGMTAVREGRLDPVLLAVLALTPLALSDLVQGMGSGFIALRNGSAAARRIALVLEMEPAGTPTPADPLPVPAKVPEIGLRQVSVRWPGASTDALAGVDLTVRAGDRLVVLGESGSGKSTLLALLLGFLPLSAGRLTVGGLGLDRLDPAQLRSRISWCEQQTFLFDSSVAENVRLARPSATDEDIVAALTEAGAGGWLAMLPDGLATLVGEHGQAVSGGERQRIGLARALLADRPVLLADEPAAHLDPVTAAAVTARIMRPDPSRITVLVTHREADVALGTRVVRLAGGRIVSDEPVAADEPPRLRLPR